MLDIEDIRHLVKPIVGLRIERKSLRFEFRRGICDDINFSQTTRGKDAYDVLVEVLDCANDSLAALGFESIAIPPRPEDLSDDQKGQLYTKQRLIIKKKVKAHRKAFESKIERALERKTDFEKLLESRRRRKKAKKMRKLELKLLNQHGLSYSDLSEDESYDS